jgi:hypothetical protein
MRKIIFFAINCVAAISGLAIELMTTNRAVAQQVTVGTPMVGVSNGFHENIGVGFGFRLPGGVSFTNGGPNGLNGGAGLRMGGPNGFLNIAADQGSSRSMSTVSPSVTVMNGGTGAIYDVTWRPFVIGFTPIVGGMADPAFSQFGPMPISAVPGPTMLEERLARLQAEGGLHRLAISPTPMAEVGDASPSDPLTAKLATARESTAGQPTESIAAIRRRQAAEDAVNSREIAELLDRARRAEAANNAGLARIYYQQALRLSTSEQRDEIEAALRSLGTGTKSR